MRRRLSVRRLVIALTAGMSAGIASSANATIRFVVEGGAGLEDGSTWLNASGDIQAMINASSGGDSIKLATIVPSESWYPPSVFYQPMKYMVFGDPSLPMPQNQKVRRPAPATRPAS